MKPGRPCKRCTDRGYPEHCKDDFSKKRGKKLKVPEEESTVHVPHPPQPISKISLEITFI